MDTLLYLLARALLFVFQVLPLWFVAGIGRVGGGLFYWLDPRHRRVALRNLEDCFGAEMKPEQIRSIAHENFRRIGEVFACGAKTAFMDPEELGRYLEVEGAEKVYASEPKDAAGEQGRVLAIGHFGNFELYAHASHFVPGFQFATTYRGLRQKSLERLMRDLRRRSGLLVFERRTEAAALRSAMKQHRLMIGFLVDQHAGSHGIPVPFFGRDCSTSAAPALFALRYQCPLHTAICYRTSLGRWRIEGGDEIPTHEQGRPRSKREIMADVNRAFEAAIRRDPANWFWVHKRWKLSSAKAAQQTLRTDGDELQPRPEPLGAAE